MEEFDRIAKEYTTRFPKEESLYNMLSVYGDKQLIEIYREAAGRRIIFIQLEGYDHYTYEFE